MLTSKGFDLWADGYDQSVSLSEEANEYPFAGYKKVLETIYRQIRNGAGKRILDIGFGTGILTNKLYIEGYSICGIDFSQKMIEIARQKMPGAELIRFDFARGLPACFENREFDSIVCTYAIHHLNDSQKISLMEKLASHLSQNGKLMIGDVAFETTGEMERCKAQSGSDWDEDERYPVAEVLQKAFPELKFEKISFFAGVLTWARQAHEKGE